MTVMTVPQMGYACCGRILFTEAENVAQPWWDLSNKARLQPL